MTKREFLRMPWYEQVRVLEDAARDVNIALNLYGRETVDALMAASGDAHAAQGYIDAITTIRPNFPASFVAAARPACNRYLRYARYSREARS